MGELFLLRVALGLTWILLNGCKSPPPRVEASIEFTRLPPSAEGSAEKLHAIEGRATGARAGDRIVLFGRSGVWWVQPFVDQPFTTIQPDSTWKNSTHPGTAYAALLVDAGYRPPPTFNELPGKGNSIRAVAIADGTVLTLGDVKTLNFSGYEWQIRQTESDPGGSRNVYDPSNAWTDAGGALHLRITRHGEDWRSAEASLTRSLGYGTYRFTVRDLSRLQPAAIFSISTWDDTGPPREMNIEIGRWGEPDIKNAQYVVQPYYVPANVVRFTTAPGTLTYSFTWEAGRVHFRTARESAPGPGRAVFEHVFTSDVPSPGRETIRMNHYVFRNNTNPLRHNSEVIVEKFEYLP